jgi:hypothetical protein
MEQITARIQGETDYVIETLDITELDKLKDPKINRALIGAKMGRILDGSPTEPLSSAKKEEVRRLLASYVANTETYKLMLANRLQSVLITSFRMKSPAEQPHGYATRVAGVFGGDIKTLVIPVEPEFSDLDPSHLLLLKFLKDNNSYKRDPYAQHSVFHQLMDHALRIGDVKIVNPLDN